ncbi:hypothetical protein [Rathayibacter iranicus]|uniref:Uncharacterized protein n=1 Tax=Rathayibacter iranicus TaxID=59737 RepID=A0AAD1AFA2_9MICO|nr:hypothetical protein [Rathayibacter iranicus]AZZ55895.1 hypothetical protein C7V51_08425 [Rathayibacter iranicus]MWV30661.1 hypothetical protein [Rathayibacter iranicus NCPPB 2253 = VKM Ac-1602]PPI47219.1 hypothetical protein C5E09_07460 [Rathayibacter iranicus]PPI60262.1 hypothetical protein C5E08_08390 [Rathayibacter iranicus]PPI71726.1 hypothetical protein C5E01_07425 [Rathayibacter iranicus]
MPTNDLFTLLVRDAVGAGGRDEGTFDQLEALAYFVAHREMGCIELLAVLEELLLAVVSVRGVVLVGIKLLRQVEQGEEDLQTLVLKDQAKELVTAEVLTGVNARHP